MLSRLRTAASRAAASPYLRAGVLLLICAASVYLALKDVSLREVGAVLAQADLRYIGLLLACVTVNVLAKTFRWKVLLGPAGKPVSIAKLLVSHLAGQTLNLVYPARIGDLSRAYIIGGLGPGRTYVLGTVVLEKVLDMLSYAGLLLFLLVLIPLPGWVSDSAYGLAAVTLGVTLLILVASRQRQWLVFLLDWITRWLPASLREPVTHRVRSGLESLGILHSGRDLLRLAAWSALVWATAILNNQLALAALGLRLPLTASLLVVIALQVGISIPVPGRIGVFEYICVQALAVFGVGQAIGVSYGILLHGLTMFPVMAAGLVSLWFLGLVGQKQQIISAEEN